ncbi:MAG: response regulator, partial [Nitrospinaceae bacterium]
QPRVDSAPFLPTEGSLPAAPNGQNHVLLYVEDNPANLELVKQIIKPRNDITLFSAPEALLGIELARAHQPDLILMDIHLPGMDGVTAMKKLKLHEETRDIPVIAVSANAMESDIKHIMAAGFHSYITKPFNVPEFINAIDRCLSPEPFTQTQCQNSLENKL